MVRSWCDRKAADQPVGQQEVEPEVRGAPREVSFEPYRDGTSGVAVRDPVEDAP